jgi:uncharacterized protein YrzB (UPF0473 family)
MPEELGRLREHYGKVIELVAESGELESFRILAEFRLNGSVYTGLQTPQMLKKDEIAFFRVIDNESGELTLESIDDDEEWETAAEGYDSLLFDRKGLS